MIWNAKFSLKKKKEIKWNVQKAIKINYDYLFTRCLNGTRLVDDDITRTVYFTYSNGNKKMGVYTEISLAVR